MIADYVRSEKEPPSTLIWTLFYLAQNYDKRGLYDIALAKIDEAMQHAPTVIDLYTTKSKILKHGGDFTAAAALADEARKPWKYVVEYKINWKLCGCDVGKTHQLIHGCRILLTDLENKHNEGGPYSYKVNGFVEGVKQKINLRCTRVELSDIVNNMAMEYNGNSINSIIKRQQLGFSYPSMELLGHKEVLCTG
nr:N-alpha-acetyltransferase 16, NatA auxiliary subunit-like [Tanacetum cinerariifolium]